MFEHELKNVYIGDVWWRLSTDFTQYTSLAQIQAQWWTWTTYSSSSPTFSYWSSWIWTRSTSTNQHWGIYMKLPSKITAKNRVIMRYTWTVSQIDGGIFMTLSTYNRPDLVNSNQSDLTYSQSYRSASIWQWLNINKNVTGTKTRWLWTDVRIIQWMAWTYDVEVYLDLPSRISKWTCKSPSWIAYTSESIIPQNWIDCIIWMEYFIIWGVQYSSWITDYIRSWEIAVM